MSEERKRINPPHFLLLTRPSIAQRERRGNETVSPVVRAVEASTPLNFKLSASKENQSVPATEERGLGAHHCLARKSKKEERKRKENKTDKE